MKIIKPLNDAQFDELVINSKIPVMILCTSPECIICKTMVERIKEAYRDFKNQVSLLSLDINKNQCWQKYDVRTMPTLLYFKHGILVGCQSTFPERKEIADKFKSLTKKGNDFIAEIDKSIEAEYLTSQFYKYIHGK